MKLEIVVSPDNLYKIREKMDILEISRIHEKHRNGIIRIEIKGTVNQCYNLYQYHESITSN